MTAGRRVKETIKNGVNTRRKYKPWIKSQKKVRPHSAGAKKAFRTEVVLPIVLKGEQQDVKGFRWRKEQTSRAMYN